MVRLALQIRAELENVTDVGVDAAYVYHVRVRCTQCHEENPSAVTLTAAEEHALPNSRGSAHLVIKCKFCKRDGSASVETNTLKKYSADDSGSFAQLVVFECRNIEFVGFEPRDGWSCAGAESGTPFADIDLTEREWTDYDEKAGEAVGIYDFESRFEATK